jgi:hypothetical protein
MHRDRDWLLPSVALTLLSGVVGILLIPDSSGMMPAVRVLPMWMIVASILGSIYAVVPMMLARVESPFADIRRFLVRDWRSVAFWTLVIFLAGLNMTTFMWIKPLLNYLVPFRADPLLASIDNAIFLGHDPWVLLTWLNTTPAAIFYHRGWFVLMIITLIAVLTAKPSAEKSALMTTYFLLWSVVGPVIHILLPAAGPVFFAQLGYGDRFAELKGVVETRELAAYLWNVYAERGFRAGSGISAMPSLHIATTAWMIVAVRVVARRWTMPMAAAGLLIFLLSISLGWHYAVDGIVGGGVGVLCYLAVRALYSGAPYARGGVALGTPSWLFARPAMWGREGRRSDAGVR